MKRLFILLLFPFLLGMGRLENPDTPIFEFKDLSVEVKNHSIDFLKTERGYLITHSGDYLDYADYQDAYIRFKNLEKQYEVSVKNNRYLSISYRSNFAPDFAIRILSTSGSKSWSNFRFSSNNATIIDYDSCWHIAIYDLSFAYASSVTEDEYNAWIEGNYSKISLNITSEDLFNDDSYLYLSSFAFFEEQTSAEGYLGLDYSKQADNSGPNIEIPYGDGKTFKTTAGKKIDFVANYYDEYDDLGDTVEGILSEGTIDNDGLLVKGNHTVTFVASDLAGNITTSILNLEVGDKDIEAPIISLNINKIHVLPYTYNKLKIYAYDEVDGQVECNFEYSEGALNELGQFLEGEHILTISASDLTGNVATKTIDIIVENDINPDNLEFIDEGED